MQPSQSDQIVRTDESIELCNNDRFRMVADQEGRHVLVVFKECQTCESAYDCEPELAEYGLGEFAKIEEELLPDGYAICYRRVDEDHGFDETTGMTAETPEEGDGQADETDELPEPGRIPDAYESMAQMYEATFAKKGEKVTHRRHGQGTVVRMLGANGDEGCRVKLDTGKMVNVDFDDKGRNDGWKKARKAHENFMDTITEKKLTFKERKLAQKKKELVARKKESQKSQKESVTLTATALVDKLLAE